MTPTGGLIRILLVDDHALFRESLKGALEAEPELCVVGEIGDTDAAVGEATEKQPDVVLIDSQTPDHLIDCIRRIQCVSADSRVLVLTMNDDPWIVRALLVQGIRGYLLKNITRIELVSAIRSVCAPGNRIVMLVSPDTLINVGRSSSEIISRRERDILVLVSEGLSNAQIASRLSIAQGTVKRHLGNIFTKLKATSRVDAVNKAIAASVIPGAQHSRPSGPVDGQLFQYPGTVFCAAMAIMLCVWLCRPARSILERVSKPPRHRLRRQ